MIFQNIAKYGVAYLTAFVLVGVIVAVASASEFTNNSSTGGGMAMPAPMPTPPLISIPEGATPVTPEQLQTMINILMARLQVLVLQAREQGVQLSSVLGNLASASPNAIVLSNTTRNLSLGSEGDEVVALQNFLIGQNKGPAAQALKSHGITDFFGSLTKAALAEFQASVGISPASGLFGPLTKAHLKTIGF